MLTFGARNFDNHMQSDETIDTNLIVARVKKNSNKMSNRIGAEIELYLNDVSKVINTKSLSQEMIDECTEHMGQSIKNSTFYYFKDNKFYQELP